MSVPDPFVPIKELVPVVHVDLTPKGAKPRSRMREFFDLLKVPKDPIGDRQDDLRTSIEDMADDADSHSEKACKHERNCTSAVNKAVEALGFARARRANLDDRERNANRALKLERKASEESTDAANDANRSRILSDKVSAQLEEYVATGRQAKRSDVQQHADQATAAASRAKRCADASTQTLLRLSDLVEEASKVLEDVARERSKERASAEQQAPTIVLPQLEGGRPERGPSPTEQQPVIDRSSTNPLTGLTDRLKQIADSVQNQTAAIQHQTEEREREANARRRAATEEQRRRRQDEVEEQETNPRER